MNRFLYLIIALILVIVSGTVGYLAGKGTGASVTPIQSSKLFQTQTANIQGKITKVNGSTITIVDDKNQTGEFTLSPKAVFYKQDELPVPGKPYSASASSDMKSISLNTHAIISLEVVDGNYQVTSISYIPAVLQAPPPDSIPPTPPPIPN